MHRRSVVLATAMLLSSPILSASRQGAPSNRIQPVGTGSRFELTVDREENWELAAYPVENHGFTEATGWADEFRRILKLFEDNLRLKAGKVTN